jgi:hypothetical protein
MRRAATFVGILAAVLWAPALATAAPIVQTKTATFASDLQPDQTLVFDSFNTQGGLLTLTGVEVVITHAGSVKIAGDNDDTLQTVWANGRIIRQWGATGPGVSSSGDKTATTGSTQLSADNGDGAVFDKTAPDGFDFGAISYSGLTEGPFNPATGLYATAGAGTVNFVVDVTQMTNDLQFGPMPDAYQAEVQDPNLTVDIQVTYTFTPEPATMALLAAGGALAAFMRRRRRA